MSKIYFLAHPEVVMDPDVAVPRWPLSEVGRARMERFCKRTGWLSDLSRIVSSTETKACDGARIVQSHYDLPLHQDSMLNEIDRSSTGYLPRAEHQAVSKLAFASPEIRIRGWERTLDAQARILGAVTKLIRDYPDETILVSSHGGVGTLLLCSLAGHPISTRRAMKNAGGGCYFSFEGRERHAQLDWIDIDD